MIKLNKNNKNSKLKVCIVLINFLILKYLNKSKTIQYNSIKLNLFVYYNILNSFNFININKFFIIFNKSINMKNIRLFSKTFKTHFFSFFKRYEIKNSYYSFFNFMFFKKNLINFKIKNKNIFFFFLKNMKLKKILYFYLKFKNLNYYFQFNFKYLNKQFIFIYKYTHLNSFLINFFFINFSNFNVLVNKITIKNIKNVFLFNYIKYKIYFSRIFLLPKNDSFISNKYFLNFNLINFNNKINNKFYLNEPELTLNSKKKCYNNYYPILSSNKKLNNIFFSKFKINFNNYFIKFNNRVVLSSMENLIKKSFFIKTTNNYFNLINNYHFNIILNDYKFYKNVLFKNHSIIDFIKIVWYSFYLKDLTLISNWITVFMESLNFKNHKKFISFFNNFLNKYYNIFVSILKIKGFFFDIRGKVGVTGSSKKRHFFILIGNINKSSKKSKIDFNQNLVRTYSGVMGLTYILNY